MAQGDQTTDVEEKLKLLIELIEKNCSVDSEHETLRKIAIALNAGDKLKGKSVSGGKTNYAYKVFLEGNPDTAVFAKVGFSFALWNPDRSNKYDLDRLTCEYDLMKRFDEDMKDKSKASVATPYLLLDMDSETRVILAEWATCDEQWGNQYIEGEIDRRVLLKVARALATINMADFDPKLNQSTKDSIMNMTASFQALYDAIFFNFESNPEPKDECVKYIREMGRENFMGVIDAMMAPFATEGTVLVHGDSHVFNILVESKPDINKLEQFGENGDVYLCDWEMAHASSLKGRDVGTFFSYPIVCAYYFAARGEIAKSKDIIECMDIMWDEYARFMVEEGKKDEQYLRDAFQSALAMCGFYHFVGFYVMKLLVDLINKEGLTEEDICKVMEAYGLSGFKCIELFFQDGLPELSLNQLRNWHKNLINDDLEALSKITEGRSYRARRKSSILRMSGRRVSDSSMLDNAIKRLSILSAEDLSANIGLAEEGFEY